VAHHLLISYFQPIIEQSAWIAVLPYAPLTERERLSTSFPLTFKTNFSFKGKIFPQKRIERSVAATGHTCSKWRLYRVVCGGELPSRSSRRSIILTASELFLKFPKRVSIICPFFPRILSCSPIVFQPLLWNSTYCCDHLLAFCFRRFAKFVCIPIRMTHKRCSGHIPHSLN